MKSPKKFTYFFPAFVLPPINSLHVVIVALLIGCVIVFKRRYDEKKLSTQKQSELKNIFEKVHHKNISLQCCFENLRATDPNHWQILSNITEIRNNSFILKTNLTTILPTDESDTSKLYFTANHIKQNFLGSFGIKHGQTFSLYTFKTTCKNFNIIDDEIYLEIAFPNTIEAGQRRAFPRISLNNVLIHSFSLWNTENKNMRPHTRKLEEEPLYAYNHTQTQKLAISNISASGVAIQLYEEHIDEKNIELLKKAPCILLLSLVQQLKDDVLNLWLSLEIVHTTTIDNDVVIGCQIKAYAIHPVSDTQLNWINLNEGEEVPELLNWVKEDLALGNHEKALDGLTKNISLPK